MKAMVPFKALAGLAAIPQLFRRDPEAGFHLGRPEGDGLRPVLPCFLSILQTHRGQQSWGCFLCRTSPHFCSGGREGILSNHERKTRPKPLRCLSWWERGAEGAGPAQVFPWGSVWGHGLCPPLSPAGLGGAGRGSDI